MAYSQTDLDNIDAAIARGELIVRIDDKEVKYQSADDMMKRRAFIAAQISAAAVPNRVVPRHMLADFSDSDTP